VGAEAAGLRPATGRGRGDAARVDAEAVGDSTANVDGMAAGVVVPEGGESAALQATAAGTFGGALEAVSTDLAAAASEWPPPVAAGRRPKNTMRTVAIATTATPPAAKYPPREGRASSMREALASAAVTLSRVEGVTGCWMRGGAACVMLEGAGGATGDAAGGAAWDEADSTWAVAANASAEMAR
jgi:hypothetical protein